MSFEVRPIAADELAAWVEVMHVAFHSNRPAEPEAEYRRDVYRQDLGRTLATVEHADAAEGRIVGTYESFTTELTLPGGACLPANAISSISVLPTHHRRGLLTRMITDDLHAARERGEAAAILMAAEYPIYGRFGFGPATERAEYRLDLKQADFLRKAPGSVALIQPTRMRELAPALFDRFRQMHAGQIARLAGTWDGRLDIVERPWRDDKTTLRCALYSGPSDEVEGYLLYRVDGDWGAGGPTLQVNDLVTLTDEAYIGLWRYAAELDLLGKITAGMRRLDEPLPFLLTDARKALQQTSREDLLWLRTLDTPRFLSARRYATEGRLVLEVDDPLGIGGGRFALEGSSDGADCRVTSAEADLTLAMRALGAMSLGGVPATLLHAAGLIDEHTHGALGSLERMFHTSRAPWCSTFF